jgi:hypothetical protein
MLEHVQDERVPDSPISGIRLPVFCRIERNDADLEPVPNVPLDLIGDKGF